MIPFCRKFMIKGELEEHHLLPKFIDNPHGKSYNGFFSRMDLCFEHHKQLHKTIILPILKKYSQFSKYNREDLLWKGVDQKYKELCKKEIVYKTIGWLGEDKND